jgi:uncharacterized protein YijF (DUF1287 family)
MRNSLVTTVIATALASTIALFAARAEASTFTAWAVTNVAFGDVLNVRKYPASSSRKQAAYPNGTVLQMTGRCTGGVNLLDIAGARLEAKGCGALSVVRDMA